MSGVDKTIPEYLDGAALKIVLIEPGDLSVVGGILENLENVLKADGIDLIPGLRDMVVTVKQVLEKIIMADLEDSAANYERIGECVMIMQEVARQDGIVKDIQSSRFCEMVNQIGFEIDCEHFNSLVGAKAAELEEDNRQEADQGGVEKPQQQTRHEELQLGGELLSQAGDEASSQEKAVNEGEPMIVDDPTEFLQDTELLGGFIEETSEHLETIEANVLDFENNPDDPEIINNIFRPFHTIKGVAGFLNLKAINKLAHSAENLLDDVRNGVRPMDAQVIEIVLGVGDFLKLMIKNIKEVLEGGKEKYKPFDIRDYIGRIKAIQKGETGSDTVESSTAEPSPEETFITHADSEEAEIQSTDGQSDAARREYVNARNPVKKRPAPAQRQNVSAASGGRIEASIKVNVEKLDALVNAVGELVIMQSLVLENQHIRKIVDQKLNRDFSQLGRITSELQKTAMSMRMVPIRQTFQKMIRLVRDLSKKSFKEVELIMEGEETEIDRNMVDSIYDPLVHMIRNSVDHGVQVPPERGKMGKPLCGTVHLRAYQKGGNMVIEIEDDGNGLNTEKIRKKAIERGLIQPEDSLSDNELNNLIFLPGFSTADKITDVSGRGVGMDVVKKGVEKLRGNVEVYSEPGKGSQFIIKLPLTLAIIDGIIVRVGSERYIIPTIAIKESLKPQKNQYKTVYDKGEAILLRDRLVPIIRLYRIFDVAAEFTDPRDAILVVVENEGRQRALMVDELLGKQEVVIKSLGGLLADIKGVAGGTILGDGRVGLILDLAGLVGAGREKALASVDETEDEFF
jgi:two-component system chemotaxis sensor kinase CheA